MNSWASDLRLALRNLARRPGFTATAVVTLALGIGVNTVVFTWAKAFILRPLPGVENAHRLRYLSGTLGERQGLGHAPEDLEFYQQAGTKAFSGLAGFEFVEMAVGGGERPEIVGGGAVSGNYFSLLGVRRSAGRLLEPQDDLPGAAPATVVSARLAERLFGSAEAAPGRSLRVRGRQIPIVGVAAAGFGGAYGGLSEDLWLTFAGWKEVSGRHFGGIQILGRLAPGATHADASAEMHALAERLAETDPASRGWDTIVLPPTQSPRGFTGGVAPMIGVLLVVVGLVLAIACANLAGLLLSRAVGRQRETAIRLSLGARIGDLARLQLAESFLLALAGAAIALWPAQALARWMLGMLPLEGMTLNLDLALDAPVLAATLGAALLAAGLSSVAPLLFASRQGPAHTLRSESGGAVGGRHKARLRTGLVAIQLGLSLAAIAGAAILVRSTAARLNADPGFPRGGGLVATVDLDAVGYDAERGRRLVTDALGQFAALPGVDSVSVSSFVPMGVSGGGNGRRFRLEAIVEDPDAVLGAVTDSVGPAYFRTLGARILRGRDFTAEDDANAPAVAVVTRAFEQRYLPDGALGRRIELAGAWREIVGVVDDFTYRSPGGTESPHLYVPVDQVYSSRLTFLLRTSGRPSALARPLRTTLAALDPQLPVTAVQSLARHTASTSFSTRMAATMVSGFGLLALLLASVGLFGLLAYAVAARDKELGLRSALGASRRDLIALVLADSARLVAVGSVLGLALALALGRLLASSFAGTPDFDPAALGIALLVLVSAAVCASLAPALSASKVAPAVALRSD